MTPVACDFCGQDDSQVVLTSDDLYLGRPGPFRLVQCRQCGLIYQNPQLSPTELAPYYPEAEYALYAPAVPTEAAPLPRWTRQRALVRRRQKVMAYHPETGRLLDIGCATGNFLATMRDGGWDCVGIEPSPYAARYAKEQLGLAVHCGTLADFTFASASFDVITLWDVLEHVHAPLALLQEVRRLLKPAGLLVINIPNPASLEAKLFGQAWAGWDQPRHLYLFPPALLRRALHEAGFPEVTFDSFTGRLGTTLLSVAYWCRAHGWPEARWRPWLRRLDSLPLRLLTLPLYKVGEALNQTTSLAVFAR